ncbi:BamA/TamA family outer membrane protein [Labilibacter marinus]|uniref:BamA/TamA family outer membrane protein n=1 Tax=Labilibacter marinus TaxID=1477105 RepID=UPI0008320099|nr:BamA/TamA family outer membrane protein [Labilibacter marinus]
MKITLLVLILVLHNLFCFAQDNKEGLFKDSLDNAFDMSRFLTEKKGVMPVPMVITEPAIGYGGGLGLGYFHGSIMEKGNIPDISGGFGGLTDNGTWMAGVFHAGFWKEDHIRYMGVLGKGYINYNYYGPNNILPKPVEMNLDTWILIQQIKFRIKESNFFLGSRYFYYGGTNTLQFPIDIPAFSGKSFESTLSELSLMVDYDSRDNVFSPTKGVYAQVEGTYSDKWLGGSDMYGRLFGTFQAFGEVSDQLNVGVRFETQYASEDTPFWAIPGINMRGVPAAKYQGNKTNLLEVQMNYRLNSRWELLGFSGVGVTSPLEDNSRVSNKSVQTVGTGFRYLVARVFGLTGGTDFAWSNNNDFAFYFVVGHAWAR